MAGRGQCIKRGERRYLLRVPQGKDASGKRVYHNETFYGSFVDAHKKLSRLLGAKDTHKLPKRTAMTYRELAELWCKDSARKWKPTTARSYRFLLDTYILPQVGSVKLGDFTRSTVKGLVAHMEERPSRLNGKKLSARTIRYTHACLRASFSYAIEEGLVGINPALKVPLPRKQNTTAVKAFTKDELQTFMAFVKDHPKYALWVLMFGSGVRPGEALALQWSDLQGGGIRVTKALVQVEPGKFEVQDLKTAESIRSVDLGESVIATLKAHQKVSGAIGGLMFRNEAGAHLDPANLLKEVKKAYKAAGVPVLDLYAARHTHATQLLSQGVHVKAVAARLGHADASMTLRAYAHVVPDVAKEAASLMDKTMGL